MVYRRFGKRLFDVLGAGLLLVGLVPLIAGVALLVRWRLGAPVIFKQRRPGRDGSIFLMYKFRTMTDAVDAQGAPLPDAVRLTALGSSGYVMPNPNPFPAALCFAA